MLALAVIVLGGLGLAVAIGDIVRSHGEILDDPDSRNFAIAFWLFLVLMVWNMLVNGSPEGAEDGFSRGFFYWVYTVVATPPIILNLYRAFTR